ncbi:MAG: Unknown protein [uncultured Thiotrichaceae bacterium]|uniref:Band 7 domain-containing protein n=1 Tax=uncultured Thiotrichaceae bacterium TaxID=298394 RepID=A0A6S6SXQ1_9GAMM|nr:MAG: Unknown protein [uncultured Thiotrichaceae bacterium]
MIFKTKTIIPESHRGLLFKNEQFHRVLPAGVHEFFDWKHEYSIETVAVGGAVDSKQLHLIGLHTDAFADHVLSWVTGEDEVGLVYQDGVLKDIKAPAQRGAYWLGQQAIEVRKLDISEDYKLPKSLARLLLSVRQQPLQMSAATAITMSTVAEGHTGFLEVDGEQLGMLESGVHVWWKFNRVIKVQHLDMRLQNMEVNGQEILTKDRVSLRINLSATWQIADAQRVKQALVDHYDFLYRELQLALRAVVSTQTLDELLTDKNLLNKQVQAIVLAKAAEYGLQLKTVGARDIVLPGDMKTILAEVVEAQKTAEANLIRRREETQATRSLHNTAKLMEGNPILLRLKELEVLENITGQIDSLNVYGGLDGVMNDMVKLSDRTKAA